jgi:hypothetical protein
MNKADSRSLGQKSKIWIVRFIKFNLVGTAVFLVATVIYTASFSKFGFWTWMLANSVGAVLQFSLITVLNRTQKGKIFDSCQQKNNP